MALEWKRRRYDIHVAKCGVFTLFLNPIESTLNNAPHIYWVLNINRHGLLQVSKEVPNEAEGKRRAPMILARYIKSELRVLEAASHTLEGK